MLVLSLRIQDGPIHAIDNETGEHITVKLLGVSGNQCRLGFEASDNIDIHRDAVYQAISKEQEGNK